MRIATIFCGLYLLTLSVCADEKPTDLSKTRFQFPEKHALIAAEVVRADGEGKITVRHTVVEGRELPALVEGHYLALGTSEKGGLKNAVVLRVHLEEVLPENQARLNIERSAVAQFERINHLLLFRPIGSTTEAMKAIPAAAPLVDESDHIEGMTLEQSRSLKKSTQNLKQIGIALHNFHEAYQSFPPAALIGPDGKAWHSWRVLLLPYLDQRDLYKRYRFDEPWDGPNNKKLIGEMPGVFHDPIHGEKPEDGYASYAAVVGADAGFVTAKFSGKANNLQAFPKGTSIRTFVDGCSNTILVGSISPKAKIPWTKPQDIELGEKTPVIGSETGFSAPYESKAGKAGVFLMCDGSVQTIRNDIGKQHLRNLLQRNDHQVVNEPPSLDRPGRNERRAPFIEYRQTEAGPEAVLKYDLSAIKRPL